MTHLLRQSVGPITTLTLNAPEALNALSSALIRDLSAELDTIAEDPDTKVVILAAAGRAFCAGHDLREIERMTGDPAAQAALFDQCSALMLRLRRLPQPVVAQVQGLAVAAGCQLVATCDIVLAAQTAKFGVNGVNIGLFCSTPMVALSRAVPQKAAFEMLATGRLIDAHEAQALGLVSRTVADADLGRQTMAMAQTLAAKPACALRIGKQHFYAQREMPEAQAYAHTSAAMVQNLAADDTIEGIAAFLEKRAPNWG